MTPEMWRLVRILNAIPKELYTEREIARLRAELVLRLSDKGLRPVDIARLINLTPAAISGMVRKWRPRLRV